MLVRRGRYRLCSFCAAANIYFQRSKKDTKTSRTVRDTLAGNVGVILRISVKDEPEWSRIRSEFKIRRQNSFEVYGCGY